MGQRCVGSGGAGGAGSGLRDGGLHRAQPAIAHPDDPHHHRHRDAIGQIDHTAAWIVLRIRGTIGAS